MLPYRSPREQLSLLILGGIFLLGIGYIGALRLRQPAPLTIESKPYAQISEPGRNASGRTGLGRQRGVSDPPASEEIVVDVVGAVKRPGVKHLHADDRIEQAIDASGGVTPTADLDSVNLAAKLSDGEMIKVPRHGESAAVVESAPDAPGRSGRSSSKMASGTVSLNSASATDLQSLPGVGPATAQKILDYRSTHGAFSSIDELAAIKGFGEKKLAKMRPFLRL